MRFDHLKTHSKATAASILSPFQIHSNLIHQRWKSKETKTIYSNRLGITYTSRYVNTKHKSNDKDGWQFMYNKRLENFNHINSTNTRTYTSLRTDTKYHQRLCATRFKFLLDKKQYCQKSVHHQKHVWRNGFNIFKPYPHPPPPISDGYLDEPIVYSSGQLRSRLDSIINKKRPPEPIHIPATIMLAPKKYLTDYKNFLYYIRSPHIISDTATPSPSTTPPTTPPPGACSVPMLVDSDEDDASPGHQKRFSNFINKCQAHQDISPFVTTSEKSIYVFLDGIITACAATNCVEDPVPIRAEMIPTDATDGEVVDAIIGRLVWRVLEMVTELRSKPLLCHEVCQSVMGDCCQMVHKGSIASWYPGGPSGL
ncbi:uncharacterized protein OCT59_007879 [Rhizophagus irregularis]|uniref:uncharacterized protein n=1 Tax=Rhizophagus irregularis TaxID=588596 RepID=UPI0033176244|nr:hypothetical protein OCT59_007879 [Rhizophagus irregularis]